MDIGRPSLSPESAVLKFLFSYGGRIVPRHPDGRLRYVGGDTRLVSVPRSIRFPELILKMGELCGTAVSIRCQLPTEDMDALVSITCDEDLADLIEEYDRVAVPKIRAFLSLPKLTRLTSPPSSVESSTSSGGDKPVAYDHCVHQFMASGPKQQIVSPGFCLENAAWKKPNHQLPVYGNYAHGNTGKVYLIRYGNHWQ